MRLANLILKKNSSIDRRFIRSICLAIWRLAHETICSCLSNDFSSNLPYLKLSLRQGTKP